MSTLMDAYMVFYFSFCASKNKTMSKYCLDDSLFRCPLSLSGVSQIWLYSCKRMEVEVEESDVLRSKLCQNIFKMQIQTVRSSHFEAKNEAVVMRLIGKSAFSIFTHQNRFQLSTVGWSLTYSLFTDSSWLKCFTFIRLRILTQFKVYQHFHCFYLWSYHEQSFSGCDKRRVSYFQLQKSGWSKIQMNLIAFR